MNAGSVHDWFSRAQFAASIPMWIIEADQLHCNHLAHEAAAFIQVRLIAALQEAMLSIVLSAGQGPLSRPAQADPTMSSV